MSNDQTASRQWAIRPADERFSNPTAAKGKLASRRVHEATLARVEVVADAGSLGVRGAAGGLVPLSYGAFGQLAGRAGAPAEYLRSLTPGVAALAINEGLQARTRELVVYATRYPGESWSVRAITGEVYKRVRHETVLSWAEDLVAKGWRVPPARPAVEGQEARPATAEDVLDDQGAGGGGLSIRIGDMIADAGIYLGDSIPAEPELFCFLVNEKARVETGTESLSRAVMVSNSERGDRAFRVSCLMYRHVCGNHILWGAQKVAEVSLRHVGTKAEGRMLRALYRQAGAWAQESAAGDAAKVQELMGRVLGKGKAEVAGFLQQRKVASRALGEQAWDACERFEPELDPRSAWGVIQGLTRVSQAEGFADRRAMVDAAAGRVMELVAA